MDTDIDRLKNRIENLEAVVQQLTGQNVAQTLCIQTLLSALPSETRSMVARDLRSRSSLEHLQLAGSVDWRAGFDEEIDAVAGRRS